MRLLLATILTLLGASSLSVAQNQECFDFKQNVVNHDVGISLYSMQELPSTIYHYSVNHNLSFRRGYNHAILHGLTYRRTVNYTHTFRSYFGYSTVSDFSNLTLEDFQFTNRSIYHGMNFRLGYERNLLRWRKHRMTWYVAGDLLGTLGNHKGDEIIVINGDTALNRNYNARIREGGLSLNTGIRYQINHLWSLNLETGIDWIRYRHLDGTYLRRDYALRVNPIRAISLNYHF